MRPQPNEKPGEIGQIDVFVENGSLKSVIIDGKEHKIADPESIEALDHLKAKYSSPNADPDEIFNDSRRALDDLTKAGYAPIFTIPREYIAEVLKNGLVPHETAYQKSVKLTAGTIGRPPYQTEEGRYIALFRGENYHSAGIQPRYTLRVGNRLLFNGIIATTKTVPLEDLLIIDSQNNEVVYPRVEQVNIDESNSAEPTREAAIMAAIEDEVNRVTPFLKIRKEQIQALFDGTRNFYPNDLLNLLKIQFPDEYESDLGLIERDKLRMHTLKVMNQFEKWFAHKNLPAGMDKNLFRLVLALHDIGKPRALAEGNKDLHHKYSAETLQWLLQELGYGEKDVRLARVLVDRDPIGQLFKSKNVNRSARQVLAMAHEARVDPDAFLELLLIFYKCDASSYTEDAGGIRNLDQVFEFHKASKTLNFSPDYDDLIYELEDEMTELNRQAA